MGFSAISIRALLIGSASLGVLATAPAWAQTTVSEPVAAQADTTSQEVVVTARRREETLLRVPVAVTAFTGQKLEVNGAIDLTDIQTTTPNTRINPNHTTRSYRSPDNRAPTQKDPRQTSYAPPTKTPTAGQNARTSISLSARYLPPSALLRRSRNRAV